MGGGLWDHTLTRGTAADQNTLTCGTTWARPPLKKPSPAARPPLKKPSPAARPPLKKEPQRRSPKKDAGYTQLEEEVDSSAEVRLSAKAGSSAKAKMARGFTGQYAEVTRDAGRRFNGSGGGSVLPAGRLLVSAGSSDPAMAFYKIGGFVLIGGPDLELFTLA